jgi:hypothetical protein
MTEEQKILITNKLEILDNLYNESELITEQLLLIYNVNDKRHFIIMVLLKRANRFLRGYINLVRSELSEPGMALVRSIFEANLLIRWCLKDENNAIKYKDEGISEVMRMFKNLSNKNYFDESKQRTINITLEKYKDKKDSFTKWKTFAKETGMTDHFNVFYPLLSAMSHGSLMSISGQVEKKEISGDSDFIVINASINVANNFIRDCFLLCSEWIYNSKIHEVLNLEKLINEA